MRRSSGGAWGWNALSVMARRNEAFERYVSSLAADASEQSAAIIRRVIEDTVTPVPTLRETNPRVLFVADHDPFIVAGGTSYVGSLIELVGGVNVAGDIDAPYPALSLESILARRPEIIIEGGRGGAGANEKARRFWTRFPDLPAVREGRVVGLPSDAVNRPGPRLPQALRELEALLHPEDKR